MGIFLLHILSLKYAENYSQGHLIEIDTAAATAFSNGLTSDPARNAASSSGSYSLQKVKVVA